MRLLRPLALACILITIGCTHPLTPDKPQLTPQVRLIDTTFHSDAIARKMHLRIIVPANPPPNTQLPVVYFLHGAGANYEDWSNRTKVSAFAAQNIILVMPDAVGSYYINDATIPHRRYEDYIVNEVLPAVHRTVPYAATDRAHTAIVGISRGGFGASVLALKHPNLFSFAGDMSGAMDFTERPFRWHDPIDSLSNRKAFGPSGGGNRTTNDPFQLVNQATPQSSPFFYIVCGDHDPLLKPNQRFANTLAQHGLPSEFHILPGAHNWDTWNAMLPALEAALLAHFSQSQVSHT